MARAKSPITQLPWCMYRTYVYMHIYVPSTRWRSRVDISRESEGLSNLHASIFTCTSFFLLLLSSRYTCLTLNYNLRVYGMTNLNSLIVYYYFSVLLSSRLLLFYRLFHRFRLDRVTMFKECFEVKFKLTLTRIFDFIEMYVRWKY